MSDTHDCLQPEDKHFTGGPPTERPPGGSPPHRNPPDGRPPEDKPPEDRPPGGRPPHVPDRPPSTPPHPFGADGNLSEIPVWARNAFGDAWWLLHPERWAYEVDQMTAYYPQFSYDERLAGRRPYMRWTGVIHPWPPTLAEAAAIIDRLKRGDEVKFEAGTLRVPNGADLGSNRPSWLTAQLLSEEFRVEVIHRPPPAHPKAWVSCGPGRSLAGVPHRYTDDGSICPLTPHRDEWSWASNTLVDYLDAVGAWLLKMTIWRALGTWIGPQSSHVDIKICREAGMTGQCPCGSGRPPSDCGCIYARMIRNYHNWRN